MVKCNNNAIDFIIQKSIEDFNHLSLSKKDTIFSVHVMDSMEYFHTEILNTGNLKTVIRKVDSVYTSFLIVSISPVIGLKFYPSINHKKDTNLHDFFPTDYISIDNTLFYWKDPLHNITSDIIKKLNEYNLIDSLFMQHENFKGLIDLAIDEKAKGVSYFFCKNDLSKYKRVVTNRASGYYKPPKLNCDCKKK
ncbi:hypothetical protein FACS1894178_8670 [Bacteroidia bacterium]|nr:hypothetical protein FACS1894178_8670 [Bacteroidia bacterium]